MRQCARTLQISCREICRLMTAYGGRNEKYRQHFTKSFCDKAVVADCGWRHSLHGAPSHDCHRPSKPTTAVADGRSSASRSRNGLRVEKLPWNTAVFPPSQLPGRPLSRSTPTRQSKSWADARLCWRRRVAPMDCIEKIHYHCTTAGSSVSSSVRTGRSLAAGRSYAGGPH